MECVAYLNRLRSMARLLIPCFSIAILAGCEAAQVANRTINQSSYLPDLQYRQVIDNLAIIADNPSALPYFNPPNTSKTTIQRTAQTNFGLQWGLLAAIQHVKTLGAAPLTAAVTKMYEPLVINQIAPGIQGTQQSIEEWDTALSLDPVRSVVMQGLYRKVLGVPCTPFQTRLIQKFFYDYPNSNFSDASMLFPDGLTPPYLLIQEAADRQNSLNARVYSTIEPTKPPVATTNAAATTMPPQRPAPGAAAAHVDPGANAPPFPVALPPAQANLPDPAIGKIGRLNKDMNKTSVLPADLRNAFGKDEQEIIELLAKLPLRNPSQDHARKNAMDVASTVLDQLAKSDDDALEKSVQRAATAIANLNQQILVQRPIRERGDSYANYNAEFRELYHSLQPGWLGKGTKSDVPKNACYVGYHGRTYVWVTPENLEQMTNLTIAILDAATANTSSASLATNPMTGGPPSLTPQTGTTGSKTSGASSGSGESPSLMFLPSSRDRFNTTPPPGPNVVPAPPAAVGTFR